VNKERFSKAYTIVVDFGDDEYAAQQMFDVYVSALREFLASRAVDDIDAAAGLHVPAAGGPKVSTPSQKFDQIACLWQDYKFLLYHLHRIFQYLDRFFLHVVETDRGNLCEVAIRIFNEVVYEPRRQVFEKMLLGRMAEERDVQMIDARTAEVCEMICAVHFSKQHQDKQNAHRDPIRIKKVRGDFNSSSAHARQNPKMKSSISNKRPEWFEMWWNALSREFGMFFDHVFIDNTVKYYGRFVSGIVRDESCSCSDAVAKLYKQVEFELQGFKFWFRRIAAQSAECEELYAVDDNTSNTAVRSHFTGPSTLENAKRLSDMHQQKVLAALVDSSAERIVAMQIGSVDSMLEKHTEYQTKLQELFCFFNLGTSAVDWLMAAVKKFVTRRCASVLGDKTMLKDPVGSIDRLIDITEDLQNMVRDCFVNPNITGRSDANPFRASVRPSSKTSNMDFEKSLRSAIEWELGKDSRCAKSLAVYCDHLFRKVLPQCSDEKEVLGKFKRVMSFLKRMPDKDVFLENYRVWLSKRLIKMDSSRLQENDFIELLKNEYGYNCVSKLALMLKDLQLSDELTNEFTFSIANANVAAASSASGRPSSSISGVELSVRVLQQNCWSNKDDNFTMAPSLPMAHSLEMFSTWYKGKYAGRKLQFVYNLGDAEVATVGFNKKYRLKASTPVAICLDQFIGDNSLSSQQLSSATGIEVVEVERILQSLSTIAKQSVLTYNEADKTWGVNGNFTNEKLKINVQLKKAIRGEAGNDAQEKKDQREAGLERVHVIQSAIVRIMKKRKTLRHNELNKN